MKKWKRIISLLLVASITVLYMGQPAGAFSFCSVNNNEEDLTKTPYNLTCQPQNVSVEEKEITGNTKHFITWENDELLKSLFSNWNNDFNVEIYCVPYLKYIDTNDYNFDKDELSQIDSYTWLETALPVVHCADVTPSDCGTVLNFTEIWDSLESIPQADMETFHFYNNLSKFSDFLNSLNPYVGSSNGTKEFSLLAKLRYYMEDGTTANYIKYSRVKYYIRYTGTVRTTLEQSMEKDASGNYHYWLTANILLGGTPYTDGEGHECTKTNFKQISYEIQTPVRLFLVQGTLSEEHNFFSDWYMEGNIAHGTKRFYTPHDGIYYGYQSTSQYPVNSLFRLSDFETFKQDMEQLTSGFVGSLDVEINHIGQPWEMGYYVSSNIPVIDDCGYYDQFASREEKKTMGLAFQQKLDTYLSGGNDGDTVEVGNYGKFVENDSTIGSPVLREDSEGDPVATFPSPLPDKTAAPGGDPGESSGGHACDHSDIVAWLKHNYLGLHAVFDNIGTTNAILKKIRANASGFYSSCSETLGKILGVLTGSGEDRPPEASPAPDTPGSGGSQTQTGTSDNADVVNQLKKIYNILLANMILDVIGDVMEYVLGFLSGTASSLVTAADALSETAETTFPFSLIFIPRAVFSVLSADAATPHKEIRLKTGDMDFAGMKVEGIDFSFTVDLGEFDNVAGICRSCMVILFLFGLVPYTVDIIQMIREGAGTGD